jgi:hypothetical protein
MEGSIRETVAMSPQTKEFSLCPARVLTLFVLIILGTGITLANLPTQPLTDDVLGTLFDGKTLERAFGWPLTWYWRSSSESAPDWTVSRYDESALATNVAIWLAIIVAVLAACEWLLRRYRPRLHWRPRVATILVLIVVLAMTVLANMSRDEVTELDGLLTRFQHGWPIIWYRRFEVSVIYPTTYQWRDFSAARFAGNLVLCLVLLIATAFASEWLVRHYWPRPRWSLRTMLAGVALAAACCAWWVNTRDRANEQDAIVDWLRHRNDKEPSEWAGVNHLVYVERRGPKWLDVVGAERFHRFIVGVYVCPAATGRTPKENADFFRRLSRLPSLRFLEIVPATHPRWPRESTRDMTATLSGMRQLRMLSFYCRARSQGSTWNDVHEYLAAIGKLSQLERLRLSVLSNNMHDLVHLSGLTNLRTLALDIRPWGNRADKQPAAQPDVLELPVLPRLEELDLHDAWVGDEDLVRLAGFAKLKALNLSGTSVTDRGLTELAPLESLQELAIDQQIATEAGFEALGALKHLRALHIATTQKYGQDALPLDHDDMMWVSLREVDYVRHALKRLRQSHPGIVIDAHYEAFEKRLNLEPPWANSDPDEMDSFMRRWLK